jgi:hypothetical protein
MATAIKLFAIVLLLCLVCEAARPQPATAASTKGGAKAAPKTVNKPGGAQAAPKTVNKPGGAQAAPKTVKKPAGTASKKLAAPKAGTAATTAPPPLGGRYFNGQIGPSNFQPLGATSP